MGVVKEVVGVLMSKRELVGVVIKMWVILRIYWGENNTSLLLWSNAVRRGV